MRSLKPGLELFSLSELFALSSVSVSPPWPLSPCPKQAALLWSPANLPLSLAEKYMEFDLNNQGEIGECPRGAGAGLAEQQAAEVVS